VPGDAHVDPQEFERWWQEHSELDRLVSGLERAFNEGSIAAAGAALEELADSLEEHFGVEERVYFPLVEQLSQGHAPAVQAARLSHSKVRERLEQVRELVAEGKLVPAREALGLLLERFRAHEAEETQLIAQLEHLDLGTRSAG
jgi:iron-sulfur cluster repair protein YtfE (RIC family)